MYVAQKWERIVSTLMMEVPLSSVNDAKQGGRRSTSDLPTVAECTTVVVRPVLLTAGVVKIRLVGHEKHLQKTAGGIAILYLECNHCDGGGQILFFHIS